MLSFLGVGFAQQPFVCDGDLFLSLTPSGSGPSNFYRVVYNGTTVNFNIFTGTVNDQINSIGFRSTDNFIYGINPTNKRLYRIDAQGNATLLRQLTGFSNNTTFYAGDISPNGNTMVLVGGPRGSGQTQLVQVDLTDPTYPTTTFSLSFASGSSPGFVAADIAFDPLTSTLYAYNGTDRQLVTIDPRTGRVDDTRFPTNQGASLFGALFFNAFGELFGYGRRFSSGSQTDFFSIDKKTGVVTYITSGPSASGNDGCSCPYRVEMQLGVEETECDTVLCTLKISNSSGTNRPGVDIELPLPPGFRFIQVASNPFQGTVSGLGTNVFSLQGAVITLGVDSLVLKAVSPGKTTVGTFTAQAVATKLIASLGGTIFSDNVLTSTPADSTTFELVVDTIALRARDFAFCTGDSVLVDRRRADAFDYRWSDGSTASARYFNQPATVELLFEDSCGYFTEEITVTENPLPTVDAGTAANICSGKSIPLFATGGQTYQWAASPFLSNTSIQNPIANPPITTMFYVEGIDENGCSDVDSVEVVVRPSPIVDLGPDQTLCAGDTIMIGSPAIAGQIYSWFPSPGIDDLFAAETQYIVPDTPNVSLEIRVTGTFRCETRDTLNLTINALNGQTQGVDILCFGESTGMIESNWQGLAPIAYRWTAMGSGAQFAGISTSGIDSVQNLLADTYVGFALDGNGCRWWDTLVLAQPNAALDLQILDLQNVDCLGNQNGSLTVVAAGGTTPYQFDFDGADEGANTQYGNLGARAYQATVRDENGCTDTLDVRIESPTGLSASIEALAHPRCFGASNGWVRFAAQGGQAPYSWSQDGQNFLPQTRWDGFAAGMQTFTLRDANGCLVAVPVRFDDPLPLLLDTVDVTLPLCNGDANGSVRLAAQGGSGAYLFSADGMNLTADSNLVGLTAGTYQLQVVDDSLCRDTFQLVMNEPPALALSVSVASVRCFGENNGQANLDIRGGTPPFIASWETEPPQQGAVAEELPPGTWLAIVSDQNGCVDSIEATITEPAPLMLMLVDTTGAFCEQANASGAFVAEGGTAPWQLAWFGADTLEGFVQNNINGGEWKLLLRDANGCEDSMMITLSNPPAPRASFETTPPYQDSIVWDERDAITFINTSEFAQFYSWSFGDGRGSSIVAPAHHYEEPGTYIVSLIAMDERVACPDTFEATLTIIPPGSIFLANAFSPNGDGINDFLNFPGEGLSNLDIRIFNRWGREVRRFNNLAPGWDGRDEQGRSVPEGVYVVHIQAKANNGRQVERVTTVTLLR
ncbi:MAG: gliding motility-associated C-terminal domain-containing protein [Bacteroidia bacterium]